MQKQMSERLLPLSDSEAVLRQISADCLRKVWQEVQEGVGGAFVHELHDLCSRAQRGSAAQVQYAKFADEPFAACYKDISELRFGIEGSLGLPGNDIAEGVEMEFCHSEDSKDLCTTSNYGCLTLTTSPADEYNFVVKPVVGMEYAGARRGIPLEGFLSVHGERRETLRRMMLRCPSSRQACAMQS
eukprot:2662981-Rhodomonas_salina.2